MRSVKPKGRRINRARMILRHDLRIDRANARDEVNACVYEFALRMITESNHIVKENYSEKET